MSVVRPGNFDLMRLVAASLVFWSHQYSMSGFDEPLVPWVGSLGGFAVYAFFAMSGYLNAQSVFRSRSASQFLMSRAFRIFPGLIVCVAGCVILGAIVTTLPLRDYLSPPGVGFTGRDTPFSFFWRNCALFFGQDFILPGVFKSGPGTPEINTPLWTLPQEAKLYVYLAILAVVCRFNARLLGGAIGLAFVAFAVAGFWIALGPAWLGHRSLTCAILFGSGVVIALLQNWLTKWGAVLGMLAVAGIMLLSGHRETFALVVIAPICVLLNDVPLPRWTAPRLDISFGVYLYALPIQHLTSTLPFSFWVTGMMTFALTLAIGTLSAILIEQPMLRRRQQLRPLNLSGVFRHHIVEDQGASSDR